MTRTLGFTSFLLAALVAGCGSSNSSTPASPSTTTTVTGPSVSMVAGASLLTSTAYSPNSLTVARGSSVTFVNNDNTSHTATGTGFDTGLINPGSSKAVTLSTAGTLTYHCTVHPGMTGVLIVQ